MIATVFSTRRGSALALAGWLVVLLSLVLWRHYPPLVLLDLVELALVLLLPGVLIVRALRSKLGFDAGNVLLTLAFAVGFAFDALIAGLAHSVSGAHAESLFWTTWALANALLLAWNTRVSSRRATRPDASLLIVAMWSALMFVLLYASQNFHYLSDGGILAKGYFGIDIPFLAGEIHGIRYFGHLVDLHQNAQPWHYHEAVYQILALLPASRTLPDLALGAPLLGCTLVAFSFGAVVEALGATRRLQYVAVIAALFLSSVGGSDLGSYALSPSFVFGSLLLLGLVILLTQGQSSHATVRFLLVTVLLLALSQTKLTSYLVLWMAVGIWALLLLLQREGRRAISLLAALLLSAIPIALQSLHPDPDMPGGDFVIGAPLLGYANHLSALLHLPLASIDPVSAPGHWHLASLLIPLYFVFHFARFVVLDPRLLAVLLLGVISIASFRSIPRSGRTLLFLLILSGYLAPVLYSPAWYPLALSFYAPTVGSQAAMVLAILLLSGVQAGRRGVLAQWTGAALLIVAAFLGGVQMLRATRESDHGISGSAVRTLTSLLGRDPGESIVNLRHGFPDAPESYYWYAALSGHSVASEGAQYGSLLAAVAATDSAKGLHPVKSAEVRLAAARAEIDSVYHSNDSTNLANALRGLHAGFVEAPTNAGEILLIPASAWRPAPFDEQMSPMP